MSKNASPSYEHIFYVNGTGISGIRDLDISYSVSRNPISALGVGHIQPSLSDAIQGEISFTRDLIYEDPLFALIGDQMVNGTLIYAADLEESNGQVIGFTSGYLTSYNTRATVGDVPTTQCSFAVFGQLGSGVREGELDYSGIHPLPSIKFINQGSIILNVDQSETNRIMSYDQQYTMERVPIYDLKEKTSQDYYAPTQVISKTPISVTTNFVVEVDDFHTANMMDNTRSGVYRDLDLYIRQVDRSNEGLRDETEAFLRDDNNEILEDAGRVTVFSFDPISGNLISESVTTSIDGVLTVALGFQNYLK